MKYKTSTTNWKFLVTLMFVILGTTLNAQIPNNTCDGALVIPVQQLGEMPLETDVIFTDNTIENYGTSQNPGAYGWCVPSNQSNPNLISVIDNFFSFVAPSSDSIFIVLDDDLDSDMQGSIRSSCTLFNNPVITCLKSAGTNNIAVEGLIPFQSYILSFMVEVDYDTNLADKNRKVSIFEVTSFVLDCPKARITEIHYDDIEGDVNEFIEITALAGESLAGYMVEIHNPGLTDIPYQTSFILDGNSTPVPNSDNSIDTILFPEDFIYFGYTFPSLLPDSPTAISLRNPSGEIVDLISYEGDVIVDGLVPLDIIVQENSADPIIHSLRSQDISGHSIWVRNINTSPNMYNSELDPVIESSTAIWQGGIGNWASENWESASGFDGISIFNGTAVNIPSGTVTVNAIFDDGSDCYSTSNVEYYETSVKSLVSDGDIIVTNSGGLTAEESIVINGLFDINASISSPTVQVNDMNIGASDIISVDITGDLQIDNTLSFGIEGLAGAGMTGGNDYLTVGGDLEINGIVEIIVSGTYPDGTIIPLISFGSFDQVLDEQSLPSGWILEVNNSTKTISAVKAVRPINDICQEAIEIPFSQDVDVASIESESNSNSLYDTEDECNNDASSRGVWYSLSAPEDATYTVSAESYSNSVSLQLFEGNCESLISLSCGNESLSYQMESSKSYFILVTTHNDQFAIFDLTFVKFETPYADITSVGVNVSQPLSTLDVDGSVRIGNDSLALPGVLRFRRNSFEGYTGVEWKSLDKSNDNLGDHKATQNIDGSGYAIKNILNPSDANDAATKQYVDNHEDGDGDDTNELQSLSINNNLISLTDGGSIILPESNPSWSNISSKPNGFADNVDNVDDADNDPNNEIISDIIISNGILTIEEDASSSTIDLSPIASQWSNDGTDIFIENNVGIGISDPQRELDVDGTIQVIKNSTSGNPQLNLIESNTGASRLYFDNSINDPIALLGQPNAIPDDAKFTLFVEGDVLTALGSQRIGINNTNPNFPLEVGDDTSNGNGAHVTNGGTWTNGSSRTFKENIKTVNSALILQKLAGLDIATWDYLNSEEGTHIGPIAEDFYQVFGFGNNERYISTVDADGVALAAIKALHETNQELQKENNDLNEKLEAQAKLLQSLIDRIEKLEE